MNSNLKHDRRSAPRGRTRFDEDHESAWRTVEAAGVKAERDVGHSRTQYLAGDDGIVDRRRRRKNAGKERV
jgi:hypothetical protein